MMTVPRPRISWKACNYYVGLIFTDYPNNITQYLILTPNSQRLLCILAETKFKSSTKILLTTINPPCS